MLILNKNILTIGGNRLEGGPLTPPEPPTPPGPTFDEVTIGTQTWMAKNLAIDDGGTGIVFRDNVTANGINFGTQYYYNWDAAVRVANSIEGWHLPSKAEWDTLVTYAGGRDYAAAKLKSINGWNDYNGTDDYGFTALPVGFRDQFMEFYPAGSSLRLWTSNIYYNTSIYMIGLSSINTVITTSGSSNKEACLSVRLIKDT